MNPITLYHSILGKKIIMAVTGSFMLLFLLLHVGGNLKVFLPDPQPGMADINVYARFLRTMGEPLLPYGFALWGVRIILIVSVLLHITCAIQLAHRNARARPVKYKHAAYRETSYPARWMLISGLLMLCYIILHLAQFTFGWINPAAFNTPDVFGDLSRAFHRPFYIVIYLGAMGLLGLHLFHGAWSLFQTLGLDNPDRNRGLRLLAMVISIGLPATFALVPLSFAVGALGPAIPEATSAAMTGGN
ncbi:succinate dehydrogenase cytochrome b subunit [Ruegeria sp. ANG-R]|uniref:succinate dehydrogenase cytochrome b subunit n=1 Tax=Ruegeria sp. ANG-R TaxID=1577903 RepID=UPI0006893CE2|nr:succinate dehydrogenase cytochrome b subunit [Ruegeria sp. ANG-R]